MPAAGAFPSGAIAMVRAIRHGWRATQGRPGPADNFAIRACRSSAGTRPMTTASPTDLIDVQALRVGMFVHLDVGWMKHPFPLSSFRITSAAQVATIRSLGLRTVRWSPQQSDLAPEEGDATESLPGTLAPPATPCPRTRSRATTPHRQRPRRQAGPGPSGSDS